MPEASQPGAEEPQPSQSLRLRQLRLLATPGSGRRSEAVREPRVRAGACSVPQALQSQRAVRREGLLRHRDPAHRRRAPRRQGDVQGRDQPLEGLGVDHPVLRGHRPLRQSGEVRPRLERTRSIGSSRTCTTAVARAPGAHLASRRGHDDRRPRSRGLLRYETHFADLPGIRPAVRLEPGIQSGTFPAEIVPITSLVAAVPRRSRARKQHRRGRPRIGSR